MEREALKLALEALEISTSFMPAIERQTYKYHVLPAITAIKETLAQPDEAVRQGRRMSKQGLTEVFREALAQPAQEPDAYQSGYHDGKKAARARCIELVLAGSSMPVQTKTLEALQRDRKRIAKLIEEDGKP